MAGTEKAEDDIILLVFLDRASNSGGYVKLVEMVVNTSLEKIDAEGHMLWLQDSASHHA